jgi:hypothetical protein
MVATDIGITPGDKLAAAIARGPRCRVTFSTGAVEVGDVRYYGKDPNPPGDKDLWVLSTPNVQHFFGLDELRDVAPAP